MNPTRLAGLLGLISYFIRFPLPASPFPLALSPCARGGRALPGLIMNLGLLCLALTAGPARAQGQDSTPAARDLLILAELLPGEYDNANQHYFDRRRGLDEDDRHARVHVRIQRVDAPAFGEQVYLWNSTVTTGEAERSSSRIATLHAAAEGVIMRHFFVTGEALGEGEVENLVPADLRRTQGCDYLFRRRGSHYRGEQGDGACRFEWEGREVYTANFIELSESDLLFVDHKHLAGTGERITGVVSGEPYWLERARRFHCYADLPGVGGGRDEPFERYEGFSLHDKGDRLWFTTRDAPPRKIGLVLQSVTWPILNEAGANFTRDSLVLYTLEEGADGEVLEHGYAFTEPGAERIGLNLKWMLVNCSIVPRHEARPAL